MQVYDGCDIYSLRATSLPSHHCPGSVMLLLERLDTEGEVAKRILYTGDFRFIVPENMCIDHLRLQTRGQSGCGSQQPGRPAQPHRPAAGGGRVVPGHALLQPPVHRLPLPQGERGEDMGALSEVSWWWNNGVASYVHHCRWVRKNGMFKETRAKHVILLQLPAR